MTTVVDHIDIRWRPTGSTGAFQFMRVPPNQGSVTIYGVERGVSYDVNARSVSARGTASAWVAVTHNVVGAALPMAVPTSISAVSLADGVHIGWLTGDTILRSDTQFEIWRAPDVSGAPGTFAFLASLRGTGYTDGITDGVVRWYKVREVDMQGNASAFTSNVNSRGKVVADGATVGASLGTNLFLNDASTIVVNLDQFPNGTNYVKTASVVAAGEMVDNPDFEAGSLLPPAGWASGGAGLVAPTLAYDTTAPYAGLRSLSITGAQYAGVQLIRTFATNPGDRWLLWAALRNTSGIANSAALVLRFYNGAGTQVGSSVVLSSPSTSTSAWNVVSALGLAPAGAVNATLAAANWASGTYAVGIDAIRLARQFTDQRLLPQIAVANYQCKYTGQSISYSSGTTGATISITAFSIVMGSITVNYNATSVSVTGTAGSTYTWYLYFDDPTYSGGTPTLVATLTGSDIYANDGRVYVGSVTITLPSSGTGSGAGSGGHDACVCDSMWLREGIRAGDAVPGALFDCMDSPSSGHEKFERPLLAVERDLAPCVRLTTFEGAVFECSIATPFDLPDGRVMFAPAMRGKQVFTDWGIETVVHIDFIGEQPVSHNHFGGVSYAAGADPFHRIYSHNLSKP